MHYISVVSSADTAAALGTETREQKAALVRILLAQRRPRQTNKSFSFRTAGCGGGQRTQLPSVLHH